jgi:hypothetical protein
MTPGKLVSFTIVGAILVFFFSGVPSEAHRLELSVEKIFAPGENPEVRVSTSSKTEVEFRIYKIKDPVSYFADQKDPHTLEAEPTRRASDLPRMFRFLTFAFKDQLSKDLQTHLTSEFRENLRAILGLDKGVLAITKSEKKERARIQFDLYPVLDKYPLIHRWTRTLEETETVMRLDPMGKGVYLVEAVHNDRITHTIIIISDLAFITKKSLDNFLLYATHRTTGKPEPQVKFVIYNDKQYITGGTSGKDGVLILKLTEEVTTTEGNAKIMAIKGEDFTISADWFYSYYGGESLKNKVYIYTERPVYRPGQMVYFKAILREIVEDTYKIPDPAVTYPIVIKDPKETEIYNKTHAINEYGSLFGEFQLKDDAALGEYLITVILNGVVHEGRFKVEEYKKPEFEVKVLTPQKHYTRGDTIPVEVQARYYFGSPVSKATVTYNVFRTRYYRPWWYGTKYAWYFESAEELQREGGDTEEYGYSRAGELIVSETADLNTEGKFRFEIETDSAPEGADYTYRVTATVVDASRRAISGSSSVIVGRSTLHLTLSTPLWIYRPGDTVEVTAQTRDFEGNSVTAVPIHFEFQENIWDKAKVDKPRTILDAATGPDGSVTVSYTPQHNSYLEITATATDSKGNQTQTTHQVYVYKKGFYYYESTEGKQGFSVIPDKNSYKVGDTARLFITSPVPDATVLLTTEGTSIYTYQILQLKGSLGLAEIKITEWYEPNVFVSVTSVFKDQFYEKKANLLVIPEEKFLNVEVTSDREIYHPQEEAEFIIKTTDFQGNPVSAEVSIGIVDASLYAISPELAPDIKKFFYTRRYPMIQNIFSDPNFYIYSSVRGKLADLRRGKKEITLADFKEGYVEPIIRKDFRETILWLPTLVTDTTGYARVKIKYPDTLTRWRATARAVTRETRVGGITQNTITRKDLIVRMEVPRFFRQRDTVTITTIAHNYLSEDKKVKFTLDGEGLEFIGSKEPVEKTIPQNGEDRVDWMVHASEVGIATLTAKALTDEESDGLQLKVPILPHGVETLRVHNAELRQETENYTHILIKPESAIPKSSELKLTFSPSLTASTYAALPYLLGYPYGCVEQVMGRFLPMVFVNDILKDLGIQNSSLTADIAKYFKVGSQRLYELQHPDGGWGWWEEDESHPYMTAYVVYGLIKAQQAGLEVQQQVIERGLHSLKEQLKKEKDPTTQLFMLQALSLVNQEDRNLVMKIYEDRNVGKGLNPYAKAILALLLGKDGNKSGIIGLSPLQTVLQEIRDAKIEEGTWVYWEGQEFYYTWQDDSIETTAYALRALVAGYEDSKTGQNAISPRREQNSLLPYLKGDEELIGKAIRWALTQRTGNYWRSTKSTAIMIQAFHEIVKKTGELSPDYSVSVYLNNTFLESFNLRFAQNWKRFKEYGKLPA